jgi:integrase
VISETFHGTKKAAMRRLGELVAQHGGRATATSASLAVLLERWLEVARIQPSTAANYRNALRHVPDHLLATPLSRIGPHELDALYASLARGGLGAPTIRVLHAALSSAFAQAIKWRWVSVNPATLASPPPPGKRRTDAPNVDALTRLLAAATDDQTALWLRLAVVTGARRSEVLALRWCDVKVDAGQLVISGSLDIHRARKVTKTGDERTLSLDPETVALLTSWQRKARERALTVGKKLDTRSYVLSDDPASRAPWRPDTASKRFRYLAAASGLTGVRLHDLRHAHATQLLAGGVDVATVARRLGHSRTSTTLDVYSHAVKGTDERAALLAASLLDAGSCKRNDAGGRNQ